MIGPQAFLLRHHPPPIPDPPECLVARQRHADRVGEVAAGRLVAGFDDGLSNLLGAHALFAADAFQRGDWTDVCETVRRSWQLNQLLDAGTNPPAVQSIVESMGDELAACKLLGAGGGGYMLAIARDAKSAKAIRKRLEDDPPNERARFVDVSVSNDGLQVTKS